MEISLNEPIEKRVMFWKWKNDKKWKLRQIKYVALQMPCEMQSFLPAGRIKRMRFLNLLFKQQSVFTRRPPAMAGHFYGGQVKFDKYQPGWQALFSPKVKQIPVMGRLKPISG